MWVLVLLAGEAAAFLALWLGDNVILAVITGFSLDHRFLAGVRTAAGASRGGDPTRARGTRTRSSRGRLKLHAAASSRRALATAFAGPSRASARSRPASTRRPRHASGSRRTWQSGSTVAARRPRSPSTRSASCSWSATARPSPSGRRKRWRIGCNQPARSSAPGHCASWRVPPRTWPPGGRRSRRRRATG